MGAKTGWLDLAREQIAIWHQKNGLYQDDPVQLAAAISRVEKNFCSQAHFRQIDAMCASCLAELSSHIHGVAHASAHILHLGSAWSFAALQLKTIYPHCRITAIDDAGRYAWAAAKVVKQVPGQFAGLRIAAAGKTRLADHKNQADCLLVTPPFRLTNSGHDRKLLASQVLQVVRPGGAAIIQVNNRVGNLLPVDLAAVMESAGFALVRSLGSDLLPADDPQKAAFVLGSGKMPVTAGQIMSGLEQRGQSAKVLIANSGLSASYVSSACSGLSSSQGLSAGPVPARKRLATVRGQIARGDTELKVPPPYLSMIGSEKCNLHCVFCVLDDRLVKRQVSEVWLADAMQDLDGFAGISLSGGEILMHRPSMDIIRHAATMGRPPVTVVSNLALDVRKNAAVLVNGISHLNCSMDAASAGTYSRLRLGGNFNTVCKNLQTIASLRSQGKKTMRISINFIVNAYNLHEISNFVRLGSEIGVDSIIFKSLVFYLTSRISEDIKIDYANTSTVQKLAEQIIMARQYGHKHGIHVNFNNVPSRIRKFRPDIFAQYEDQGLLSASDTSPLDFQLENEMMPDGLMPCLAPFTTLACHPANNAFFCCDALQPYRSIPVDPGQSLMKTFNQPLFQQARKLFLQGEYAKVCSPFCGRYQQFLRNAGKNR